MESGEVLVLRPGVRRHLTMTIVAILFVACGIWLLGEGHRVIARITIVFFGAGTVVFLAQLLPDASYLRLDPDGFAVRSLYREHRLRWDDVGTFVVVRIGVNKMVGYGFSAAYKEQQKLRRIATAVGGTEAALPETYGRTPEALAALLNEWKERAPEQQPNNEMQRTKLG